METVDAIMKELERMGTEQTRKTFIRHGAPAQLFGVKVGDMKTIVKRVKKNHELATGLFATGHPDAQYLAGLIGDEKKMSQADLQYWAEHSSWSMISEYAVPFVAAESVFGWKLALDWIQWGGGSVASTGWATLAGIVSVVADEELDKEKLKQLLDRVSKTIHAAPNRVRYTMNGFVIAVGSYVPSLAADARKTADRMGPVQVDMGGTACQVPDAAAYIDKVAQAGRLGKKRKTARC